MRQDRLFRILQSPHQTEKTDKLGEQGQYVFKIEPQATKQEVKQAVEQIFQVKVSKVSVVNVRKERVEKFGRLKGWRKGWKKAYVGLEPGHHIEFSKLE